MKDIRHNHEQDILHHEDCPRCVLNAAAPELLEALKELQKQIFAHHKRNVRKESSLLLADAAASKAIARAEGR